MPPKSQIILAFRLPKFSFHSIWDLEFGIIWNLGFRQLVIWNLGFGIWDFGIWILNLGGRYRPDHFKNSDNPKIYKKIFESTKKYLNPQKNVRIHKKIFESTKIFESIKNIQIYKKYL